MALYDMPRSGVAGRSVWGQVSTKLATLVGELATWNDRRMTRRALQGLTARELDDIGLMRSDIDKLGRG